MAKRRKQPASSPFSELKSRANLREVRRLIEEEDDHAAAHAWLAVVCRDLVVSRATLREAIDVSVDLRAQELVEWATATHHERWRDSVSVAMMAAAACVANGHVARALAIAREVLRRWPGESEALADARDIVELAEGVLPAKLSAMGLDPGDLDSVTLNERTENLLEVGRLHEAERVARELLSRRPLLAAAGNNLAQSLWEQGRCDDALSQCDRVVSAHPGNVHALSNRVRYLTFLGQPAAAKEAARRLLASTAPAANRRHKVIEGLAAGLEHQAIVDVFDAGSPAADEHDERVVQHFAAAAMAWLGRDREARALWQPLRAHLGSLVEDNLEDLELSPGERHGPWYFPFDALAPSSAVAALSKMAHQGAGQVTEQLRAVVEREPALRMFVPLALEVGGPDSVRVALSVADASRDDASLDAVRRFMEGRRGCDVLRFEALYVLGRAGRVVKGGTVEMFSRGARQRVQLTSFDVHGHPESEHSADVLELVADGHEAIREDDLRDAEACFREALQRAPGAADLTHNLAFTLERQGRTAEARQLTEENHRRHPEYLFARAGVARLRALNGDVAAAEQLLAPLEAVGRFHLTELTAYATARAEVAGAGQRRTEAEQWRTLAARARLGEVFHALPVDG